MIAVAPLQPTVLAIPGNGFTEVLFERGARLIAQFSANLFVAANPAGRKRFADFVEVKHRGPLTNTAERFADRCGNPKNRTRQRERGDGPAGGGGGDLAELAVGDVAIGGDVVLSPPDAAWRSVG